MTITQSPFSTCAAQLREFIRFHSTPSLEASSVDRSGDSKFAQLALSLFFVQFATNAPYRQFCQSRKKSPASVQDWRDIPAVPTSAFKEFDLTGIPPDERTHVFHSSGTTVQNPSRHFHNAESLSIYEASLFPWFRTHVFPEHSKQTGQGRGPVNPASQDFKFISLTPPPDEAPHSSLVHMFATAFRELACSDAIFASQAHPDGTWKINFNRATTTLDDSIASKRPVVLLGTAFNFIHLLDDLAASGARFQLPPGSRVMETGGYKGRSRALPKSELHSLLARNLGIPLSHIICEYGMSELSSQAYDSVNGPSTNHSRRFQFPPWARTQIISPETGREVADGETGLIRIFDLANLCSVMAIQAEDLAVRRGDGFELLGRAVQSEPRGCSLMSA